MIVNESYEPRTPAKLADEITAEMRETAYEMRKLAPDSGAYINEVSPKPPWISSDA